MMSSNATSTLPSVWLDPMSADPGVQQMLEMRAAIEPETGLPQTLGELVRQQAQIHGDEQLGCWIQDGATLTYKALDEAADRLASSLLDMGVRKGTHVGVMLPNVSAFPVSWVALGRIGAVMVPVNTAYTGEEMHFVLNDADAQFLIVDSEFLGAVAAMPERPPMLADERLIVHGSNVPSGMRSWAALEREGAQSFVPPSPVGPNDLLNLQYTSGTTGFPKGCMLTHDYWLIISRNAARMRGRGGEVKNVFIWAPFFYMDPMWQFLMTIWLGGSVFIARKMSLTQFHEWLRRYEIHMCIYPEPALKQPSTPELDAQLSLKYVSVFGWGEDARKEVEQRFNLVAREGYGMTEVGGGTTMPVAASHMAYVRSCGLPSPFRELRIVDPDGNDLPPGEVGELWVSGRAIFWGYYKRPEANAESFRGKWFRTGDLFRRDANGYCFLVGRIKDMVKRSGENIAAIEVEAALRAMPEIEEAAIVAVPDPLRREEVKAYIKLRDGLTPENVSPQQIFQHCEGRLAAFKIPRYIAYMETDFPRTPTRKIVKRMLVDGVADLRVGAYDRVDG
ncbi:MAG: class I adenylate-forming enzyme family protein, partial [Burkholderiaceae bacterium]